MIHECWKHLQKSNDDSQQVRLTDGRWRELIFRHLGNGNIGVDGWLRREKLGWYEDADSTPELSLQLISGRPS
jgi:hypothetical protein